MKREKKLWGKINEKKFGVQKRLEKILSGNNKDGKNLGAKKREEKILWAKKMGKNLRDKNEVKILEIKEPGKKFLGQKKSEK